MPKVHWDKRWNCWRSDCGPRSKAGRRSPVYFRQHPGSEAGRRAAQKELEAYIAERDRLEALAESNSPTCQALAAAYLEACADKVVAGKGELRTCTSHEERLLKWLRATDPSGLPFSEKQAELLSEDDGGHFVETLQAQGLSVVRIRGVVSSVKACLSWSAAIIPGRSPRRLIPVNPWSQLKVEAVGPKTAKSVATRDQFVGLLRAARTHVEPWTEIYGRCAGCVRSKTPGRCSRSHTKHAIYLRLVLLMVRLQFHTISRPRDICQATWKEIEFNGVLYQGWTPVAGTDEHGHTWGLITVKGKTTNKTGVMRRIPVPPVLTRAIERVRLAKLHDEWIFPRQRRSSRSAELGGRWDTVDLDRPVRKWREMAGLPKTFTLYAMRRGAYSRSLHRGGLTLEQAGRLGGSSAAVIQKDYLQEDLEALVKDAMRAARSAREFQ